MYKNWFSYAAFFIAGCTFAVAAQFSHNHDSHNNNLWLEPWGGLELLHHQAQRQHEVCTSFHFSQAVNLVYLITGKFQSQSCKNFNQITIQRVKLPLHTSFSLSDLWNHPHFYDFSVQIQFVKNTPPKTCGGLITIYFLGVWTKAWSIALKFHNNWLIEPYWSELVWLYILKIDVENSELSLFCRWGQLEINNLTM